MSVLDSFSDLTTLHQPIPTPKRLNNHKITKEVFEDLHHKFATMKQYNTQGETFIVIMKELMNLTKRSIRDEFIREKSIMRISGLLCHCLKRKYGLFRVTECVLIILLNINPLQLCDILKSIITNLPPPCDELIPLIRCMISLFSEYHINIDIQKMLTEYLLKKQEEFDINLNSYLIELLENERYQ